MDRKIKPINIAVGNFKDKDGQLISLLYAICDDGSIWLMEDNNDNWIRLKDIPDTKHSEVKYVETELTSHYPEDLKKEKEDLKIKK